MFSTQVIRYQTPDGLVLFDAGTPEKAKAGWLRLFRTLKEEGLFKAIVGSYTHPYTPEKVVKLFKQVAAQFGTVEELVGGDPLTVEAHGPEWAWPSKFSLNVDGMVVKVSAEATEMPLEGTSKSLQNWNESKSLYGQAEAGDAKAAMELCRKIGGVSIEGAIDPREEGGE